MDGALEAVEDVRHGVPLDGEGTRLTPGAASAAATMASVSCSVFTGPCRVTTPFWATILTFCALVDSASDHLDLRSNARAVVRET
jgi:hypothetical protein